MMYAQPHLPVSMVFRELSATPASVRVKAYSPIISL
jgi:hypothetical protein